MMGMQLPLQNNSGARFAAIRWRTGIIPNLLESIALAADRL